MKIKIFLDKHDLAMSMAKSGLTVTGAEARRIIWHGRFVWINFFNIMHFISVGRKNKRSALVIGTIKEKKYFPIKK